MKQVIHYSDASQDYTLCGDSDDGVLLDEVPVIAKDGEAVTCPRCLQIITHCVKYAAQQSRAVDLRQPSPRKNKSVRGANH